MNKYFLLIILISLTSCNGIKSVKEAFVKTSPYEQYSKSLEKSDVDKTAMGIQWLQAGQEVFNDSIFIDLPFSQTGYFLASTPKAYGFQFNVKEGQVLIVTGAVNTELEGKLFIDLFISADGKWESLAYADSTLTIKHEFESDQRCLLRLQPELLVDMSYTINLTVTPALVNPVAGASNRSIRSIYGDARDGGNRRHEGVDIFAPRGTPVIAPADGYVSRVGTNRLGGKVIWMRDRDRSHSYYFAHLDSQLVKSGTRVKKYDTLGLVGNTGNARTTPPHLHFGIYQRGSKDPMSFIRFQPEVVNEPEFEMKIAQEIFTVNAANANLRSGPDQKHEIITTLKRNTYLNVVGKSGDWYNVLLPDHTTGYIFNKLVSQGGQKLQDFSLEEPAVLLSTAKPDAVPLKQLNPPMDIDVLAYYNDYRLIETPDGLKGWILNN